MEQLILAFKINYTVRMLIYKQIKDCTLENGMNSTFKSLLKIRLWMHR